MSANTIIPVHCVLVNVALNMELELDLVDAWPWIFTILVGLIAVVLIRPLQVILWFLVHRPHQILFLDFYLIISLLHWPSLAGNAAWDRGYLIIGFLSHYFYYACAKWSMWYKMCDNDIHLQNNEIHKVKLIMT